MALSFSLSFRSIFSLAERSLCSRSCLKSLRRTSSIDPWPASLSQYQQQKANKKTLISEIYWAQLYTDLYFNLVCAFRSRLEYCLLIELRAVSPFPCPPVAGANVGREAVVIVKLEKCTDFGPIDDVSFIRFCGRGLVSLPSAEKLTDNKNIAAGHRQMEDDK